MSERHSRIPGIGSRAGQILAEPVYPLYRGCPLLVPPVVGFHRQKGAVPSFGRPHVPWKKKKTAEVRIRSLDV